MEAPLSRRRRPRLQVAADAERAPAGNVGDPGPVEMDSRIASAFADGAKSADVAKLVVEVEGAANAAAAVAKKARDAAMDPLRSRVEVNHARQEMIDSEFDRDRLGVAAKRLGERLVELRAIEKARAQRAEHESVLAERDKLAAEMERMGEPIAEIAGLVAQIDACDRKIRNLNATTGLALGHIRPVLAGAPSIIAALFRDGIVLDAFIVVAGLQSPPVTKGKVK
jgi:hypothetical protein